MAALTSSYSKPKKRGLKGLVESLLSPQYFNFKLLFGSVVGVSVIIILAVACCLLTFRNQRQDEFRSYTMSMVRSANVIENDIAALENTQRGYLLAHEKFYTDRFEENKRAFQRHSGDLIAALAGDSQQRKQVLKMREIVQNWLTIQDLSMREANYQLPAPPEQAKTALGARVLDEARDILNAIERDEQIALSQRVRDQEWSVQSTQVLDFIPRMQGAVYEMQKEKRGYVLTGEAGFIESYRRATADFYTFEGHLAVLVANAPAQAAEVDRIRAALESWIVKCAVPDIEARHSGREPSAANRRLDETLMNNVRGLIDNFRREQTDIFNVRARAAAHERILTTSGVDFFCVLVAALMIASSGYSFVIYRRQFKKLESAETRMRSVMENILDGMITLDKNGAIHSMNPAAKRMFGYRDDEFAGTPFAQLVPKCFEREIDGHVSSCQWEELVQRTGAITLGLAQTRGRATFPVEISLSEMLLDEKKFYVAMIRDITERHRFEEELAAEKNSLAVTLGSIGDGVITTDLNGRILILNPACEKLTGWSAAEAAGQKLKTVLNIATDTPLKKRLGRIGYRSEAEAILLGTPERSTLTARDGTRRVIEQVAAPISDGKNELCGVVLVFRDITHRLRDEAERRKAETLDQLGLLAGGIAHDFNNLLTAVIGNISLVALIQPENKELNERLEDAKNASLRARDLAQQLLTFARGGAPIKKAASIGKLIEETASFSLRGSQSRAEINLEPNLWPAEFDPGQISQVIANLVVNAEQAMPEGGVIHIDCSNFSTAENGSDMPADLVRGEYIRVVVRDQGVGIPEKSLKQIFDPYFTTKPKGSGLGLATTYSVVKNHGGLITVDSKVHVGSSFTVYLPAAPHQHVAEPIAPKVTNEEATRHMNGNGRVLIVDDEEAIRALVEFTLVRLGYEVSEADTALKGVELYREALEQGRRFDLVILDLTLPGGMGGKDALKMLLEIDPTVTAIVSSGYATDATMSRYQDLGFRGVMSKPYDASELGRTVQEIIQASRVGRAAEHELQQAC